MSTGSTILHTDYNTIRGSVELIWGTGEGQQGYGQTMYSSLASSGEIITKAKWDSLALDIINLKTHQDGIPPPIVDIPAGAVIRYGAAHPNTNFSTLAQTAIENRFNIGPGRTIVTSRATTNYTSGWKVRAQCTLTVTFNTVNEARYFFNSGGKIRFASTRSGGATTNQNNAWTNLLNSLGTYSFGVITDTGVGFYGLTTSDQIVKQINASSSYLVNTFYIKARCNCTDPTNVNGTANQVVFTIFWDDDYIDADVTAGFPESTNPPGDVVDGTLTISIEELRATGPLLPSGTFTITPPAYNLSSITAS